MKRMALKRAKRPAIDSTGGMVLPSITMPVITFKVTEEEACLLRESARLAKAPSLSAFIRNRALGTDRAHSEITRGVHPVSGLPCNTGASLRVNDDRIKAALADFP